jgi:molecular chaperone IbpA
MTNTWDIYLPHAVGLSDVFHRLDSMTQHDKNYPPYNLIKYDTSNYEVQIALAGFKPEEIELPQQMRDKILRSSMSTKASRRDLSLEHGNWETM